VVTAFECRVAQLIFNRMVRYVCPSTVEYRSFRHNSRMPKLLILALFALVVAGCATSKPPPYVPQLYDYLAAVDGMIDGDKDIRTALTAKFEIISIMYWLDVNLKSETNSSSSFIEYSEKTATVVNSVAYVGDAANELLQMFAMVASSETRPEFVDDLIREPTPAELFLICRIGIAAIEERSDLQKSLLPPEPTCPVVIAEYRASDSEFELGFLGHMGDRFHLTLSPESEPG
jgi:hypothetical protein